MSITRRRFLEGTAYCALAGAAFACLPGGLSSLSVIGSAQAQSVTPSRDDLMRAGPQGDMAIGAADAPVTLIEYASMTCTHCATFHNTIYPQLKQRYIDSGKVRYILREFPFDPLAAGAFMLARCSGQEKYFTTIEKLFQEQKNWAFVQNPLPPLMALAKQMGFTDQSFEACLSDQKTLDAIENVRKHANEKLGVRSTPTFFINGKRHEGLMTMEELERQIEPLLKS